MRRCRLWFELCGGVVFGATGALETCASVQHHTSVRVRFPRCPHPSISFRGRSSPGRGHASSPTDCTTCSGLGMKAHTHIHVCMLQGRLLVLTHASTCFLFEQPDIFLSRVSSSFFSLNVTNRVEMKKKM